MVIDKPIPGFPAKRAGLKKNDCVTHIAGFEVNRLDDVHNILSMQQPYVPIEVRFIRGKKEYSVMVEPMLVAIKTSEE